ncbi:hypothetical protein CGCS363_v013500 [Colletotrichum siamense]|uniref:uncharacterized protein n=1 Tax=Colletotrichum siamense TaxID=690259 RepID=UPI0018722EC1|nr:uncharacterized protein CGCS363_v013500 [Colletotrichum siamense]KAF5487340.1 hypothetical protein CGCS363_v013500 [Colletotrichum siamense]
MDPATAIGVASGVIAFIDFSWKLVTGAKNLYDKGETQTTENVRIGKIIKDLKEFSLNLDGGSLGTSTHEKALRTLATDCGDLCQELINILEKLKAKRNSRWETFKTTWASMRRADDINDIERRLGEYRAEMNTRLLALVNEQQSGIKSQLDVIQTEAERLSSSSATELKQLRSDFVNLLRKLEEDEDDSEVSSASSTGTVAHQELFSSLNEISHNLARLEGFMQTTPIQTRILENLYFEGIFNRVDSIEKAGEDTFEWILQTDPEFQEYLRSKTQSSSYRASRYDNLDNDSGSDASSSARLSPHPKANGLKFAMSSRQEQCMNDGRRRFQDWLSADRGIFHISGKAGCGKSTLLKLIVGHEKTAQALQKWVGENKLILCSFFFWRSDGDKYQRTLTGMRRSVLFSTLQQCPHLIPMVLPQQWHHVSVNPSSKTLESELFRSSKIDEAFDRLIALSAESDEMGLKWCLFIDGLDEYDASNYDQRAFARSLRDWARTSSIKICVTSRPEVHFLDTFSSRTRIHLHELTDADIYQSARCTFEKDEIFPRVSEFYLDLVERIVKLAEGVFLWARLVVKMLITEACLHSSYIALRAKLRSTPIQLDDLYDTIFSAMSRDDKRKAYFLLLLIATNPFTHSVNSTVFDYIDSEGNLRIGRNLPEYTYYVVAENEERLSRQIQNLSKGLLVLSRTADSSPFLELGIKGIRFFHRTVKDYVLTPSRTTEFQHMFPTYDSHVTHVTLRMVEIIRTPLRLCDIEEFTDYFLKTLDSEVVLSLATMRILELVWREKFNSLLGIWSLEYGLELKLSSSFSAPEESFLTVAVLYGHIQYLQNHLEHIQNVTTIPSHGHEPNSHSATAKSPVTGSVQQGDRLLLSAVLARRHCAPMIEMLMSMGHSMKQQIVMRGGDAANTHTSRSISLWMIFVHHFVSGLLHSRHFQEGRGILLQVAALERILAAEAQDMTFILIFLRDRNWRVESHFDGNEQPKTSAIIYTSTVSEFITLCLCFQRHASDPRSPALSLSDHSQGNRSVPEWVKTKVGLRDSSEIQLLPTDWFKDGLDNSELFRENYFMLLAIVTKEEAIFQSPTSGIAPTLRLW